jgi:hypothetical protein
MFFLDAFFVRALLAARPVQASKLCNIPEITTNYRRPTLMTGGRVFAGGAAGWSQDG